MSKICSPWKFLIFYINYLTICCHQHFESYKPFLEKIATPYFLRPHPLPLPPTSHVYAESGIIYQLVHMKNIISVNNKLIIQKIIERSHSLTGFSKYVTNIMLENYKYECTKINGCTCCRIWVLYLLLHNMSYILHFWIY